MVNEYKIIEIGLLCLLNEMNIKLVNIMVCIDKAGYIAENPANETFVLMKRNVEEVTVSINELVKLFDQHEYCLRPGNFSHDGAGKK